MKPKNTSIIMERKNQSSFTPIIAFFLHLFSAQREIKFTLKLLLLQDKFVISLFLKLAVLFGENNASFMGSKNQSILHQQQQCFWHPFSALGEIEFILKLVLFLQLALLSGERLHSTLSFSLVKILPLNMSKKQLFDMRCTRL